MEGVAGRVRLLGPSKHNDPETGIPEDQETPRRVPPRARCPSSQASHVGQHRVETAAVLPDDCQGFCAIPRLEYEVPLGQKNPQTATRPLSSSSTTRRVPVRVWGAPQAASL